MELLTWLIESNLWHLLLLKLFFWKILLEIGNSELVVHIS